MQLINVNSWERLETETEVAYTKFREYLNMPAPRNLAQFARDRGESPQALNYLVQKYAWHDRVRAYDLWLGRKTDERTTNTIATFQAQVITEEFSDYTKMRSVWEMAFDNIVATASEKNMGSFLSDLKKLTQIRLNIDTMARRATRLPANYGTQVVEQDETIEPYSVELTANGPVYYVEDKVGENSGE